MKPFILVVSVLLSLLSSVISCDSSNREEGYLGVTKEEIQERLDKKIRRGASPSEVIAALNQLKVDHSEYMSRTRQIEAIVRDVKKNFPVTESIQIIFIFDERDAFSKYELKSLFTGP